MLKFTILNGKVIVDTTILMRQEFVDILEYGSKGDKKDRANKLLLYVFYCCDLTDNNPLKDIDYRMKEDQAEKMAFKNKPKKFNKGEDKMVDAAIDAYNFLNETSLERASLAYDQKIDEVRTLLESLQPEVHSITETHICDYCADLNGEDSNTVPEITGYVSNDKIIQNLSKQLNDMAVFKLKALETAKKIENTGRVRGDKGSSLIERGAFKDQAGKANG